MGLCPRASKATVAAIAAQKLLAITPSMGHTLGSASFFALSNPSGWDHPVTFPL